MDAPGRRAQAAAPDAAAGAGAGLTATATASAATAVVEGGTGSTGHVPVLAGGEVPDAPRAFLLNARVPVEPAVDEAAATATARNAEEQAQLTAFKLPIRLRDATTLPSLLGGEDTLVKERSQQQGLRLKLRPAPDAIGPLATIRETGGILLRVTRRRRLRDADGAPAPGANGGDVVGAAASAPPGAKRARPAPAEGSSETDSGGAVETMRAEVVGAVPTVYEWMGLADFQFVPSRAAQPLSGAAVAGALGRSDARALAGQQPRTLGQLAEQVRQQGGLSLVPSMFTKTDHPVPYHYKDTTLGQRKVLGKGIRDAQYDMKSTKPVPSRPIAVSVPKRLEVAFAGLQAAFRERPVWSERALGQRVGHDVTAFRDLLIALGYVSRAGPWRRCWIRLGYDPRKDVESLPFQQIDCRLPPAYAAVLPTNQAVARLTPASAGRSIRSLLGDTATTANGIVPLFCGIPIVRQALYSLDEVCAALPDAPAWMLALVDATTPAPGTAAPGSGAPNSGRGGGAGAGGVAIALGHRSWPAARQYTYDNGWLSEAEMAEAREHLRSHVCHLLDERFGKPEGAELAATRSKGRGAVRSTIRGAVKKRRREPAPSGAVTGGESSQAPSKSAQPADAASAASTVAANESAPTSKPAAKKPAVVEAQPPAAPPTPQPEVEGFAVFDDSSEDEESD